MSCGIYKITNLLNQHSYIGQSIRIEERWKEHKQKASSNSKQSLQYPLYRAIRKYGIENFSFTIIKECDIDELNYWEIYYIEFYDTFINGYNQTSGGEWYRGHETPVYQYDLDGNLLKIYPSMAIAAEQTNTNKYSIYRTCKKLQKTAGCYQWRNNKDDIPGKTTFGQGKRVYQYDTKGNFIKEYPSLMEASRSTGLSYRTLKRAINSYSNQQTSGGYVWTRIRKDK